MNIDFEAEIESIQQVLERLDEVAIDTLREFLNEGDPNLKDLEKKIHRARRALSKAINELSRTSASDIGD